MNDLARVVAREMGLFVVAGAAALATARALPRLTRPAGETPPAAAAGLTFPNPATLPPNYVSGVLAQHLRDGDAVLFGSSELAFHGETAPHLFFPKACGRPLLTIGRAGYQSLPILLTLTEVSDALSARSDVTIILSPGWFAEHGTPSGAFLRYLRPDGLRELFAKPNLPPGVRRAIAREVRAHRDDFSGLYPDWLLPWVPSLVRVAPAAAFPTFDVPRVETARAPAANFDWDAAEATWRADQIARSKGNPLGTDADYFERSKDLLPKSVTPLDRFDIERQDLYALSELLRSRGTRARFLVQPLHRRVYRDLAAYDQRLSEAIQRLIDDGHRVVDFGQEPFDRQLLQDSVHFSGYGWVRAQREMCSR